VAIVKFVSRSQKVAVVSTCWRKGMEIEEIVEYLDLTDAEVTSIVGHLEWSEGQRSRVQPTPSPGGVACKSAAAGP
jgi:hypothetical protein